jgi:nicotinate-nucleotide pyrophosphorylase (carboxylating)
MQASPPFWSQREAEALAPLLKLALDEDLADAGDLTGKALLPEGQAGRAWVVCRSTGVIAGLPAAEQALAAFSADLHAAWRLADGAAAAAGTRLGLITGPIRALLAAERTMLNILQRLSGVATQTRRYVDAVAGLPCIILDTRKTTPGWRILEKYAVHCGGGHNHRMGLFDGILIKDNHLAALPAGPDRAGRAVRLARQNAPPAMPIEIEVDTLELLAEALAEKPDIVLLDNMGVATLGEAVRLRNRLAPAVQLEASGGITLANVRAVAETGVERISVGALTHSAPALDIALDYETTQP